MKQMHWILIAIILGLLAWILFKPDPAPSPGQDPAARIKRAEQIKDSLQLQLYLQQDSTRVALQQRDTALKLYARQTISLQNLRRQNEKNSQLIHDLPPDDLIRYVTEWISDTTDHRHR